MNIGWMGILAVFFFGIAVGMFSTAKMLERKIKQGMNKDLTP